MKRVFAQTRKFLLASSVVMMSAFALTSCDKNDDDGSGMNNNTGMFRINGNASGTQMVPTVTGNGSATMTGTYNSNTGVMNYTTTWTGLSGGPTGGAFFGGASGANGTMMGSSWNMGTGLTGAGTYSGTMTLTADQATQLRSGNMYYTIRTANNANGEIRGQMTATPM